MTEQAALVYSVAYRLAGNPDDAADLAQDVMVKVRGSLPRLRPGSLEGWLLRVTTTSSWIGSGAAPGTRSSQSMTTPAT
ncbi:MAG: sigma factor [Actinomycetota bacterium]